MWLARSVKITKWLASYIVRTVISVAILVLGISLGLALIKFISGIVEGSLVNLGDQMPTWTYLLSLQLVCSAILGACLFIEDRLEVGKGSNKTRHEKSS